MFSCGVSTCLQRVSWYNVSSQTILLLGTQRRFDAGWAVTTLASRAWSIFDLSSASRLSEWPALEHNSVGSAWLNHVKHNSSSYNRRQDRKDKAVRECMSTSLLNSSCTDAALSLSLSLSLSLVQDLAGAAHTHTHTRTHKHTHTHTT